MKYYVFFYFLFAMLGHATDANQITSDDIIVLDVGGTLFKTTRSTLCKYSGPLAAMFDVNAKIGPSRLVDGAYFFDDNPKLFEELLNFLRYGIWDDSLTAVDPNLLKGFADKWCPELSKAIDIQMLSNKKI